MKVQPIYNKGSAGSQGVGSQISFKATPQQILQSVDSAPICNGKKFFLKTVASYFSEVEKQLAKVTEAPSEFIFKLGKKNEIPESMRNIGVVAKGANGERHIISLSDMDKELNGDSFKCSPTSTCSCGKGFSKGGFFAELLEMIGLEKSDVISISKN